MRSSRIQGRAAFTKQHLLCGKTPQGNKHERKNSTIGGKFESKTFVGNSPIKTSSPNSAVLWMCRSSSTHFSTGYPSAETEWVQPWTWSTSDIFHGCCLSFKQAHFQPPTRCLTVSRCSLVMECLHGPGTSVIVRGKLRNRSTHRHFTCNWNKQTWCNLFVSSPFTASGKKY